VLDPSSGVVSGVPGQVGTFGFSVQVADALARLDRKAFSIVVSDPRPAATAPDVTITEGNTGTKDLVFTVSLSFPADATVTVSYTTADGTATAAAAAADYVARSGVLSFAPGVVSQAVSVPVIGDWVREPGESFFLLLSTPVNALLPRDRIRATIQDDDTRPNDWNGDGRSDLLWSHTVSGSLHAWMLEGTTAKAYSYLTPARPSDRYWQIRALADFDGDGWTDVLWQHQQSGELYVWFLEGTARKSGVYLTPRSVADRNWVVRGAGDFDRDGHPDLLWYHQATGALSVWLMTGTTMKQSVSLSPGATADTRWQVRALADFDGDGQVDLLWHHERSGELSLWKMNGTTRAAVWPLNPSSMPDVRWKIASVLDFDGDGKPDILWHHQRTGDLAVWYLDGAVRVRQEALSPPRQDPYWRLAPRWDPPAPTVVRRTRTK